MLNGICSVSTWIQSLLFKYPHTCFLSPTHNSEGVIAYYWSQFDIPIDDLEILPEFSEERVLDRLENSIVNKRSTQGSVRIMEVTASCRYPQGAGGPVTAGGISIDYGAIERRQERPR